MRIAPKALSRVLLRGMAAAMLFIASLLVISLSGMAAAQAQVASGPGAWSGNQTWAADTVNGGKLSGYFYWPASQPVLGGKRALVLVLHGCLQTAAGDVIDKSANNGYNWRAVAEQYGAVILAPNATGNVYSNHCWDYASTSHNRTSGHDAILLDLIQRFVGNAQYAIDPKQVYVTGLSSGGGETMALGCMAPDIFAGVGINAGPPPGTTTVQIGAVPSGYTAATATSRCNALAGSNRAQFATQIASAIWGTTDYTVAQAYGPMDAAAMRGVYGGSYTQGSAVSVPTGGSSIPSTDSNGKLRTTEVTVTGMGHAWPAGSGGQNSNYVDATKVNYPAFVMGFWFANNLRVSSSAAPVMDWCSSGVSGGTVTISGGATDTGGSISSYRVVLNGPTAINDATAGSGASFSKQYNLADGNYSGSVTAFDSGTGLVSGPCPVAPFLVGPAPAIQPPTGLAVGGVTASSIALSWNAVSGATGYRVYRDGVLETAGAITATAFTDSGLAAGTRYSYQVSALDARSAESALSNAVSASTSAGWTCNAINASNHAHVQAGRAHDSGGYALANGSNQRMGLDNLFYTSILAQTSAGYYVVGNCP